MKVTLLPEPRSYPNVSGPRCSKQVSSTGTSFYGGRDPKRCARAARFKIDGSLYCTQHAGELALKHVLENQ